MLLFNQREKYGYRSLVVHGTIRNGSYSWQLQRRIYCMLGERGHEETWPTVCLCTRVVNARVTHSLLIRVEFITSMNGHRPIVKRMLPMDIE